MFSILKCLFFYWDVIHIPLTLPFKVFNPEAFSTFTKLCINYHCLIPVCLIFLLFKKIEKQKCSCHSINIMWPLCSFVAESEVHDFRMMTAIYQPTNQCSHSFDNCSNFLELSVEILKLWDCHFKRLARYLAWTISHFQHHRNIRILEWPATVRAHSHA